MSGSLSRIVNRAGIVIVAIWTCVVSVCGFLTRENAAHLFGAVVNADLGHSLGVHGSIVRLFGVGMNRGVPCYQYRLEAC